MPINVVSRGRRGRVFLQDEREDGVIVLLVCEVADEALEDALSARGVLYPSDPPKSSGGTFPMPKDLVESEAAFELTIDTSDLKAGFNQFRLGTFVEAAGQLASSDVTAIRLGLESAREFGLIESLAVAGEGDAVGA